MDLRQLLDLCAEHKELYEYVLKTLEVVHKTHIRTEDESKITNKGSSTSEETFTDYKDTNKKQSNKLDTSSASPIGFQKSSSGNSDAKTAHMDLGGPEEKEEEENLILKSGLQHITLKQALNASSSRFRDHMPLLPRPMEWGDFVEAAYALKTDLHISQSSWANACVTLGRTGAAICVLLTDRAATRDQDAVTNPAGYFKAMINRAQTGELKLHQSIFGILKREDNDNVSKGEGAQNA